VASIHRFEDVIAWQKARQLTREIYLVSRESQFERDFGLRDQVRRASVSVMANIAEGFERKGAGEFGHFLMIAKASCAEVRSHLYVALDAGYLDAGRFEGLSDRASEVGRLIAGLHAAVVRSRPAPPTRHSELGTRNSER
jgi:four helix bundle protein